MVRLTPPPHPNTIRDKVGIYRLQLYLCYNNRCLSLYLIFVTSSIMNGCSYHREDLKNVRLFTNLCKYKKDQNLFPINILIISYL